MTAAESLGQSSALEAALDQGLTQISAAQTVTFTLYNKYQMSADGYVFWIATSQFMTVSGSLHYATDRLQDEDQTVGMNHVLLNADQEISQFNDVAPDTMWIGSWPISGAAPLQVAFGKRANYYPQANIWHYSGIATYPAMQTQIIASPADLPASPIVSNSLPIWLEQTGFAPIFPSFLVPDNIAPPYIVVHIDPDRTEAFGLPNIGPWPGVIVPDSGSAPLHDLPGSQLCRDEVVLILYGMNNAAAWQFLASLMETSASTSVFGVGNFPVISDAKRTQVEIAALAMKKQIVIEAWYNQGTADALARRQILSASGKWSFARIPQGSAAITFGATGTLSP